jgi:hypothetical protein
VLLSNFLAAVALQYRLKHCSSLLQCCSRNVNRIHVVLCFRLENNVTDKVYLHCFLFLWSV